jgi:hypothetical protein
LPSEIFDWDVNEVEIAVLPEKVRAEEVGNKRLTASSALPDHVGLCR